MTLLFIFAYCLHQLHEPFNRKGITPVERTECKKSDGLCKISWPSNICCGFNVTRWRHAVYLKKNRDLTRDAAGWTAGKSYHEVQGYDMAKNFNDAVKNNRIAPATVYWSPEVAIDKDNKIKISFNQQLAKKLKLTMEGIDASAKLLPFEKIVDVQ